MRKNRFVKALALGGVSLGVMAAGAAAAQDVAPAAGEAPAIEDIVVTAQKRSESVQRVPLSIIALSEEGLAARNIDQVRGLERSVPSLRIDAVGLSTNLTLRIRGFGSASASATDPSVATYVDGVYIPRPGALVSSFLDVGSAEVLRGPQGTLFGRNATVGAISLNSVAPSTSRVAGKVTGQIGNYDTYRLEGAVNVPLSEDVAVRTAAFVSHKGGFVHNLLDGNDYGQNTTFGGRVTALAKLAPNLEWTVSADYAKLTGDGVSLAQVDLSSATPAQIAAFKAKLGGNIPVLSDPPSYTANQNLDGSRLRDSQWGLSSRLDLATAGDFTLRLIDAYRSWDNRQRDEIIFTPLDLIWRDVDYKSRSHSHELQIISPKDKFLDGKLSFVAGLYYFNETYKIGDTWSLGSDFCNFQFGANAANLATCSTNPLQGALPTQFDQRAESFAGYGQAEFEVAPGLKLQLGGRQTWDNKSATYYSAPINPAVAAGRFRAPELSDLSIKNSNFSWRGGLMYQANSDVMMFGTYSTSYKAAAFNSGASAVALGSRRIVAPELAENFELGIKSAWMGRRLVLNATLFETRLKGFQERSFDGTAFILRNAGDIRARGLELEAQVRPFAGFRLEGALTYLDSKYTNNRSAPGLQACTGAANSCPTVQDLTGQRPTFSPKWQWTASANYETGPVYDDFKLNLQGNLNYSGHAFSQPNLDPATIVGGQLLLGANITLASDASGWSVALFGDNLTDKRYYRFLFYQTLDASFGVRNAADGSTLMRGYQGDPRTVGLRVSKKF